MATITHGSSLPDSAQKTDFYAIIDNATISSITGADISSSANIQDSQLATITTADKVNVSSLTGTIPNSNLAQITTPALVSGAALTFLPNIPALAGLIPVANVGRLYGAPVSKSIATIYQALTDGLVEAFVSALGTSSLQGSTDSSSTPATNVQSQFTGAGNEASITFKVKANDYYEVICPGSSGFVMTFTPQGS